MEYTEEVKALIADRDKTIADLNERLEFEQAARIASNEAEQELRARVQQLEQELEKVKTPQSSRDNLSPELQALLEETEKRPPEASIISSDSIINTALANFMARTEPDSEPESDSERSYTKLSALGNEPKDDEDANADEGAPYGRSVSGEYLDPDEDM